jgi:hypothetical protein
MQKMKYALSTLQGLTDLKLKQYKYECDSWKRLMIFLMEENVQQKNRIGEILKENYNANLLQHLDTFQSDFIKQDEIIGIVRNDIAELETLLLREIFEDGKILDEINQKVKKLRISIEKIEKDFGLLKQQFNSFLSEPT